MANTERIARTPKAWEALSRPDLIGRRAHSLLLLANGRRSGRELAQLLGEDIEELSLGLHEQGYLQTTPVVIRVEED